MRLLRRSALFTPMQADHAFTDAWKTHADNYSELVETSSGSESDLLRRALIDPVIVDWCGDVTAQTVLDAGCGPVGAHAIIDAGQALACDINIPNDLPGHARFDRAELTHLPYRDGMFDVVVSSLVLMWVADLEAVAEELRRVTCAGGRLIATVTHPYFYRAFEPDEGGRAVLVRDLSKRDTTDITIAGKVGPFPMRSRRPTDYVNVFAGAGWNLERSEDLFIDTRLAATLGESTVPRFTQIPIFSAYEWVAR